MRKRMIWAAVAAVAVIAVTGTIAVASGGGDEQVTGPDADRAIAAALKATGGGTANGVERYGSGFEVEVTTTDGSNVDVRVDADFQVVSVEGDDPEDGDEANEASDAGGEQGDVREGNDTGDGGDVEEPNDADDGTEQDDTDDAQEPDDPDDA